MLIRPIASSRMRIFVTALCNEIISQAGHLLHPTTNHQPMQIYITGKIMKLSCKTLQTKDLKMTIFCSFLTGPIVKGWSQAKLGGNILLCTIWPFPRPSSFTHSLIAMCVDPYCLKQGYTNNNKKVQCHKAEYSLPAKIIDSTGVS